MYTLLSFNMTSQIWKALIQHNTFKSYGDLKRCNSRGCILMVEFDKIWDLRLWISGGLIFKPQPSPAQGSAYQENPTEVRPRTSSLRSSLPACHILTFLQKIKHVFFPTIYHKREVRNAILDTKGKDVLPLFQYATNIYGCLLTVVALYVCHEVITVRWHLYVCCIVRKETKESCSMYLIWYFQPPPLAKIKTEIFEYV